MPLDPRLILGAAPAPGSVPPFDPLQAMGRVVNLQGAQQAQQVQQLQLQDAQRQEQERRDLGAIYRRHVVTDPQTGQSTIDLPGAMTEAYRVNPVTAFKMQSEYTKTQTADRTATLEAAKAQLDQTAAQLDVSGRIANGIRTRIQAGGDPQEAWTAGLAAMRAAGIPTPSAPPTFDAGFLAEWEGKALTQKDALVARQKAVDQQLQASRLTLDTRTENRRQGAEGRAETKAEREEREAGVKAPNYGYSNDVNAEIYARHGQALQPGQSPTPAMVQEATAAVEQRGQQGKEAVAAATGATAAQTRTASETASKRLEALDKGGLAAQDTHVTLDEIDRLITEGIYGNGPLERAAMTAYRSGLSPGDTKGQRTARLQELGNQLILARGSLGSNVSNTDAQIYAKAAGNFQQAKNVQEMQESIKSMRTILNKAIEYANRNRAEYERTGRLPPLEGRPAPGTSGSWAAGGGTGAKILSEADITNTMDAQTKAGTPKTRQEVIEAARKNGYTVPEQ